MNICAQQRVDILKTINRQNIWGFPAMYTPYTFSVIVPRFCSCPSGMMVMEYSPLSAITRFLSSREPVARSNVTLLAYAGLVTLTLVEVMMLAPLKLQLTDRKGICVEATLVVNLTEPPMAPLRGPLGRTPSPTHTPYTTKEMQKSVHVSHEAVVKPQQKSFRREKSNNFKYLRKPESRQQQSWAWF